MTIIAQQPDHALQDQRVRSLYEDYCACLDDGDFERWPSFFTEDCSYRVQSAENHSAGLPHSVIYCDGQGMLRDRVSATGVMVYESRRQRRFISGVKILHRSDVIRSTANFMLVESMIDRDPLVVMVGKYFDEIVDGDGGLKFLKRLCVYDNYRIVQNLIFPV